MTEDSKDIVKLANMVADVNPYKESKEDIKVAIKLLKMALETMEHRMTMEDFDA